MSNGKGWFRENALPEYDRKEAVCPECGQTLIRYVWEGDGDPPLKKEPEGKYWKEAIDRFKEVGKLHAEYQITEDSRLDDPVYLSYPQPPD